MTVSSIAHQRAIEPEKARDAVREAMKAAGGSVADAARTLKCGAQWLREWLKSDAALHDVTRRGRGRPTSKPKTTETPTTDEGEGSDHGTEV